MNLNIRQNYYKTLKDKTESFTSFFEDTNMKKKELHGSSNNINYKMSVIQDKINAIN